jgi:hypothetical protein
MIKSDDIIKASDYTGTNIFESIHSPVKTAAIIKLKLKDNLEQGLIDQEQFNKAEEQLNNLIMKAGAGSRGGKVIGHTRSGKPIYESGKHADYGKFHEYDHEEAANHHSMAAEYARVKKNSHETLRSIAEEEKNRDGVKEHASKVKEYSEKESHHSAHAQYHAEESRPKAVKDRTTDIGKRVGKIRGDYSGYDLQKGGEGSKGGKIIGHTKSGKPIYANANHSSHSKFTSTDHAEAATLHGKLSAKHAYGHDADNDKSNHHFDQREAHMKHTTVEEHNKVGKK